MRKALILAYDFPPLNSIGAQRPYSWFKYFKEFGIEPIVVTRHWDREFNDPKDFYEASIAQKSSSVKTEEGVIIRAAFHPNLRDRLINKEDILSIALRKGLTLAQVFTEHHFSALDNKYSLYQEAEKHLSANKVDVIIATGEPFILFSYAAKLSCKFNIPWVADYRDGWSTNNSLDVSSAKNKLLRTFFKRLEYSTVSSSALVTTAAPDFSRRAAALLNRSEDKTPVIYNGYFEELHEKLEPAKLDKGFTIAHAGTIYPFQKVETFLEGTNLFKHKHSERRIVVTFYGLNMFPEQMERIRSFHCKTEIRFTDKMPHREIIQKLRSTHVQLLLANPEVNQIYAKVFDYIATGRPILMVENDNGPLEQMLSKIPNAKVCVSAEEVCNYLEYAFDNESLKIAHQNEDNTFTRRNQTKRFAELILKMMEENDRK